MRIVRGAGRGVLYALIVACISAGCATQRRVVPPPLPPPPASLIGTASWYGPGFNGKRTSSGAVYNQEDLTAASTLYPLGSRLLVTNLNNDRAVEVTVNDHGPYVKGRAIDLSRKAARLLDMIGPGTAPVRLDLLASPAGGPALGERYFVQLGAFANPANARRIEQAVAGVYPDVHIDEATAGANRYYRVRMGAFSSRQEALNRATRVAGLGVPAIIITE